MDKRDNLNSNRYHITTLFNDYNLFYYSYHSEHADFLHSPLEDGDRNVHQWPWVETAWTVTLTTCFALRSQRRYSSSWMDRVQVSGKETRKIYYRNDPVKYDLNFTTEIPLVFKRFGGTVWGLGERNKFKSRFYDFLSFPSYQYSYWCKIKYRIKINSYNKLNWHFLKINVHQLFHSNKKNYICSSSFFLSK